MLKNLLELERGNETKFNTANLYSVYTVHDIDCKL